MYLSRAERRCNVGSFWSYSNTIIIALILTFNQILLFLRPNNFLECYPGSNGLLGENSIYLNVLKGGQAQMEGNIINHLHW